MQGVRKRFGARTVLDGIDLTIGDERVAVMGENGAGKSTLLRIAAATLRPTGGTVTIAGTDAAKSPEEARRGMSFLAQEAPLYPELTPRQHLHWWARAQGVPPPDAESASHGIPELPARRLSRGQRQRLALAMAFLPERPLLILDEPFTGLDEAGRAWLNAQLRERRGATLLCVHDAAVATDLGARVVRLASGRLEEA